MATLNFGIRRRSKQYTGVRPLDVRGDAHQVVPLLEKVFNQNLSHQGDRALGPLFPLRWPWQAAPPVPGFVYVQEGEVVGNVSLMPSKTAGRYLVANVAVHPDQRRLGVGRAMMEAVIAYVKQRSGEKIVLQVEEQNVGAADLYRSLGFADIGVSEQWQTSYGSLRRVHSAYPVSPRRPDHFDAFSIQPIRPEHGAVAYQLDAAMHPLEMNWPDPPHADYYQRGFKQWWENLVEGRHREIWVVTTPDKKMIGVGVIETDWGRPYVMRIRILPRWRGEVARPLLAKLVRRLHYLANRPVQLNHLKEDTAVTDLLSDAGFRRQRTLVTMSLRLTPTR